MNTKAIITEDFTNGSFNLNSVDYWQINGTGTDFRAPNNRNFDYALSNRIATGGGSFSDSFGYTIPDTETIHPSGLQQFKINKDDEVVVVGYTTFSDVAKSSREQYHVQVALLQSDRNLNGAPNYGHDLSLETESRFISYSASNSNRLQLTANVENIENINSAQRNAYYSNTMTAADLNREYSNLVIWRDLPGNGVTNIEQWATNAIGDYNVNAEMANQYAPNIDSENALFNEVRVFLQRGGTNADIIRDNVNINDAQIGLTKLHVGITKKTDFNLDYRTDAQDFIIWYNFYNSTDVTPTMLTGDADNDKAIAFNDFELWKLNKGEIHDSSFNRSQSVYTKDSTTAINSNYVIPTANNTSPVFVYDPSTGELKLNTKGESLVAWIVRGQTANSIESLGNNWWTEAVGNTQQWVDLDLTGFSSNELVTVARLEPNLDSTDFSPIQISFANGGTKEVDLTLADVEEESENEIDTTALIAELLFEEGIIAVDSSPFGLDNPGSLLNGANFASVGNQTVVNFDGNNDYLAIANSTDINLGTHSQRTISLWFQTEDINISHRKQVLYEEGGTTRGLNIYLDKGELYLGGWNVKESGWSGTYLSSDSINSNQWHHVALVLDGTSTVQPDSMIAYLDGREFARGAASQLWSHGDGIGLGNINGTTKFHTGDASGLNHGMRGNIDRLQIFNRVLNGLEIESIYHSIDVPDTEINPEEGLIANLEFTETTGTIAADSSPFGLDNPGSLLNGADFASVGNQTVVNFDGNDDYAAIANSTDINLGTHSQRTISLWFQADSTNNTDSKQVLYEEGGTTRGLNIYLDKGELYLGGWNVKESGWSGTYLSSDSINSNQWHHVALVLNGESTVQPDSMIAYLDGREFARGAASQLWSHGDGIGLGNINGATKFHRGDASGLNHGMKGNIDQLQIFNRALDGLEIDNLFVSFADLFV